MVDIVPTCTESDLRVGNDHLVSVYFNKFECE